MCEGKTFNVCARCTGIYTAIIITSLVLLLIKNKPKINFKLLIFLSLPMLVDVVFYSIGLYHHNKYIAAFTGLLFGSTVFLYILEEIENYLANK